MKTLSAAALLALLVLLRTATPVLAEEVPVCSMPRDEFVEAAFPDSVVTKLHGGKLLKYASQPGLIVMAPKSRSTLGEDIDLAFDRISKDGLVKPFHGSFMMYETFADAQKVIQQFGRDNIFVLVAAEPNEPSESTSFRSTLQLILHRPEQVEVLITQSEGSGGFASRNRVDVSTGEVISTVVLISPKYEDSQVGLMTYIAYYTSLSPNASSVGQGYLTRFFSRSSEVDATLTNFARQFFRLFADDRVKFGMTERSFVECTE